TCLDRYWMPELPPCMRNLACNSKSPAVPLQMRNVLVGILPSVLPTMAPSCTLHSFASPCQPDRSLPLNSDSNSSAQAGPATARRTVHAARRNILSLQWQSLHRRIVRCLQIDRLDPARRRQRTAGLVLRRLPGRDPVRVLAKFVPRPLGGVHVLVREHVD